MPWSEITVAGQPCELFEPAARGQQNFALIYLHGVHLNRLADQPVFTELLERHGLPAICPRTGRSWWTDKICQEFHPQLTAERHVLDNVMPFLAERFSARPPGVALLGTSMGGQGALRLAFKYPDRFPVVAAISPAIDYHLRWREGDETLPLMYPDQEAVRQDTAILHVHPLNWPRNLWFCCDPADARWHASAERLHSKLVALGIPHERDLETSGGGHGFAYYNRMAPAAFDHLADRLLRESRRVK